MFKKLALLTAALALTLPAFADTPPAAGASAPTTTSSTGVKKHHASKHKKSTTANKDAGTAPK
jgi:hypothetical protein